MIASQVLTASQLANDSQIQLELAHTAGNETVVGSFALGSNGDFGASTTFSPSTAAHVFDDQTFTRAQIMSFSNDGVIITGAAEEGQTLTAETVTNDPNATINYQWEELTNSSFSSGSVTDIGTDSATYVVQQSDENDYIRVVATTSDPSNPQPAATATSAATGPIIDDAALSVSTSVVSGAAVQIGQTLVSSATITGDSSDLTAPITYQWQVSNNGGTTWSDVPATTTGQFSGQLSSFYQISQADLGDLVRVQATFTDDTGQIVTAASTPTVAVAEIAPILTVPFSYAVDEFTVSDGLGESFADTFNNGPPPIGGLFGSTPLAFQTSSGGSSGGGSTWSEVGGQAIMSSSGAAYNGTDDSVQAILLTSNLPEGSGTGESNSGLKENDTFTVSGTFDLVVPQPSTSYGIELNEALPAPGTTTQQVQIQVFGTANGGAQVHLGERDPATGVFTLLASYTLTAAQLSGNNQIELDLVHDTANSTAIAGSFELIDNGTPTFSYTFSQTGELFADSTAARALIQGISTDGVLITGTAQQGQTLTAETSTNDPNATISYQWQESNDGGQNWTAIAGATNSTYTPQTTDVGETIEVVATASDPLSQQSVTATSASTGAVTAVAQGDEWLNTSGGTWTDSTDAATNWSDGALPRSIDNVLIDRSGSAAYTVTIPNGASAGAASLTLDASNATLSDQGTLTLNGALTIDAGTFQLADGGTFGGVTLITNAGIVEFAEFFTLANSITNTGTLQVEAGETLTLVGVTISGGTLSTASTGAIDVTGTSTLSGMTVNGGAIADGGTLNIAGLVTLEGGANITGGAMSIGSGATLDTETSDTLSDVTVSIANTGTLKVDPATGATLVLSGGTTVTGGTLWINTAGAVQVGTGGAALADVAVTDDTMLSINASTTLLVDSGTAITGGAISDLGTLEANGGLVTLSAGTSLSGSGNIEVTNSGTADFLDAFNQAVTFSGSGTLELAQSTSFSAALTGFNSDGNSGDVIDLQDVAYAATDYAVWTQTSTSGNGSGTLQIYDSATLERTLNLAGLYSPGNFALTADSGTGTEVIASPTAVTVSGLTGGNAEQGDPVTVNLGTSLSDVIYTWLLNGQVVLGDSTDSYTPAYADQGKTLDVVVSFIDPTTGNTDQVTGVAGTVQANPNDLHWNNSGGGNWTTVTDWTPNTVPNSTTQIAFVDASGTYIVNITSTVTVGGLTDASSTATLEINGGTLNADGAASITNLILTGTNNGSGGGAGTLQGSGTVDITNTLTSSGFAEMGGSGTTILDVGSAGSTLDFGLSCTLEIGGSAAVLANNSVNVGGDGGVGTVEVLSGGTLVLQSGPGESDAALANSGSDNSVSNAGDLIESGSGLRRIDVAVTNTGTVDAQSGTLDINGGGSSSGILQAEVGATLEFATGSFSLAANSQLNDVGNLTVANNGTLTTDPTDQVLVSGALNVTSGGTLNLNSAIAPSSVTINGGTLNANATLTTATMTLTGTNNGSGGGAGTLGGSGTVQVTGMFGASSFAEMGGSGTLVLDASSTGSTLEGGVSRTIEVGGSASIAANTSVGLGSDGGPGALEVLLGGTLTLQSTAGESDVAINGSGSGNSFSNAGTLIVSGGGQRNVGVALSNTGTVNVQSGTLLLNAGGLSSGTVQAESGATIQFGGGGGSGGTTFTLAANSQLNDAGNLSLIGNNTLTTDATDQMSVGQTLTVNGGTLNANASFAVADFTLTGTNNGSGGGAGLLSGSGTLDVSGTLTMSGFNGMEGSGTTILDAASTGSLLEGGLSRTLEIGGSASIQSNNAVTIGGEGAAGTLEILSGGTLTLLSGSGENSNAISNSGSGNTVSNAGTLIESGSGQRNIAVALSNSGTIEVQSGTLDVTTAVSGTGSVQISGGGVAEFGNTFNENVAFSGAGTLELAQSFSGTISGFDEAGTSDTLALALSAARSGDAFTVTPNYNGTTTTLTVTDTAHTGSTSVLLAGNYSSAALAAQNSGLAGDEHREWYCDRHRECGKRRYLDRQWYRVIVGHRRRLEQRPAGADPRGRVYWDGKLHRHAVGHAIAILGAAGRSQRYSYGSGNAQSC